MTVAPLVRGGVMKDIIQSPPPRPARLRRKSRREMKGRVMAVLAAVGRRMTMITAVRRGAITMVMMMMMMMMMMI